MNKTKFFFAGIAFLSMNLASCSSDEPAIDGGGNETPTGDRYMAVRISTAGLGGSRAGDDQTTTAGTGFEEGTAEEGNITAANTRFFFFDADGNAFTMENSNNVNGEVATNMVTPTSIEGFNNDGNGTGDAQNAVLILGKAAGPGYQGQVPAQAVCVVGFSSSTFDYLKNISLSTLATKVKNYKEDVTADGTTVSSFILTNSNWKGAGDNGAVSISDKIAATPDAAKTNPAVFYMERLAVKVRLNNDKGLGTYTSKKEEGTTITDATYTITGESGAKDVKLQVVLDGWQLINTNNTGSYLIKQLPTGDVFDSWNAPDYHRSYWAATPSGTTLGNTTYNIWEDDGWRVTNGEEGKFYTNEYTAIGKATATNGATLTNRSLETTAIVIRGHVRKVPTTEGATATNLDLVRWAGAYYELGAFKSMVAAQYNKDKAGTEGHEDVTADKVDLTKNENKYNVFTVKVKGAEYPTFTNVQYWKDGATSFYLNIKNSNDWYGVVRNHIYEYAIDHVVGLGIPGNDPGTPEETETFVAAYLYELNWKLESNTVTLQ